MEPLTKNLSVAQRFKSPQPTVAPPPGKLVHLWQGFRAGIGLRRDNGSPEARRMAYRVSAAGDWGGVDTAYDSPFLGPQVTDTTVLAASAIRKVVQFPKDSAYYMALGTKIYKSSTGTSGWAQVYSDAYTFLDLDVFQGTNSNPIMIALQQNYNYLYSADGTTWTADYKGSPRTRIPLACYLTADGGTTYTDSTSDVSDSSAATVLTLSSMDTKANGDWLIIGCAQPFVGISVQGVNYNGNASVLSAEYYNGSAWTALSGLTDGTSLGGATFGQDGSITWTRPNATWPRVAVVENTQASAMQLVRLFVSAQLDASTTVKTINVLYFEEGDRIKPVGRFLWKASDRNRLVWTEDGGPYATWNESADYVGDYSGSILGLVAANDTVYLKNSRFFGTVLPDGSSKTFWPELFTPPANLSYQGLTSWVNDIYLAHDAGFYKFDSLTGEIFTAVGLSHLYQNDSELQGRCTAMVADRDQFLYAAFYNDTTGRTWVAKTRGELQNGPDGNPYLPWHVLSTAASIQISTMTTYVDSSSQPQLVMGATNGHTYVFAVPKGQHPLDPDSGCRFTTVHSYLQPATLSGAPPTRSLLGVTQIQEDQIIPTPLRNLAAHAWTVTGHGFVSGVGVALSTRDPASSGSWTSQGSVESGTRTRTSFKDQGGVYSGTGVDVRLDLYTNSNLVTPVVDALGIDYTQPIDRQEGLLTLQVICGNQVRDQNGRLVPRRAEDWKTVLNTVTDVAAPFTLVTRTGDTLQVLVQDREESPLPEAWGWGTGELVTLTLAVLQ